LIVLLIEETQKHKTRIFKMKDVTFNCHITQEYINDLLNEIFDYQSVIPSVGSDGKYHWLYIIINKTNGHFFIGRRSKLNYLVGLNVSRQKELQEDFQKLGPNAFLKYDLHYYNSYEEMMMAIEEMFGDDFIEYFHEQRGTCYNARSMMISSKMISTKEHDEDVSINDELVKNIEVSDSVDTIDKAYKGVFFHHWMTRNDEMVCVPNDKCSQYIKNGFVFQAHAVTLYKDDKKIRPSAYGGDGEYTRKNFAQRVLDYLAKGWTLAKDWKSAKDLAKSRRQIKNQLSLDLDVKQTEVKQEVKAEVKQLASKSRPLRTVILEKDGDRRSVFLEELMTYLKQGYFVVRDQIRVKRGAYIKTILMISKKEYAQSAEDKISMRKIKSLQLLGYLENGWEIA